MHSSTREADCDPDEISCDREVWEINCRNEGVRQQVNDAEVKTVNNNEGSRKKSIKPFIKRDSTAPTCESCEDLQKEYNSLKTKMEFNLTILKEKIVTTDELIRNYQKKCLENERLAKKLEDVTEKLKKCYGETGVLRIQLEKARQANEPLKKSASRFEIEKALVEDREKVLTEKLRTAEGKIGDLVAELASKDGATYSSSKNYNQLVKENETMKEKISTLQSEKQKLKDELKTIKVSNRKSTRAAGTSEKKVEKLTEQIKFLKQQCNDLKKQNKGVLRASKEKQKSPKKCNQTKNKRQTKASRCPKSANPDVITAIKGPAMNDSSSEDNSEISNLMRRHGEEFSRNITSPSPPLSPIPPSPFPIEQLNQEELSPSSASDNEEDSSIWHSIPRMALSDASEGDNDDDDDSSDDDDDDDDDNVLNLDPKTLFKGTLSAREVKGSDSFVPCEGNPIRSRHRQNSEPSDLTTAFTRTEESSATLQRSFSMNDMSGLRGKFSNVTDLSFPVEAYRKRKLNDLQKDDFSFRSNPKKLRHAVLDCKHASGPSLRLENHNANEGALPAFELSSHIEPNLISSDRVQSACEKGTINEIARESLNKTATQSVLEADTITSNTKLKSRNGFDVTDSQNSGILSEPIADDSPDKTTTSMQVADSVKPATSATFKDNVTESQTTSSKESSDKSAYEGLENDVIEHKSVFVGLEKQCDVEKEVNIEATPMQGTGFRETQDFLKAQTQETEASSDIMDSSCSVISKGTSQKPASNNETKVIDQSHDTIATQDTRSSINSSIEPIALSSQIVDESVITDTQEKSCASNNDLPSKLSVENTDILLRGCSTETTRYDSTGSFLENKAATERSKDAETRDALSQMLLRKADGMAIKTSSADPKSLLRTDDSSQLLPTVGATITNSTTRSLVEGSGSCITTNAALSVTEGEEANGLPLQEFHTATIEPCHENNTASSKVKPTIYTSTNDILAQELGEIVSSAAGEGSCVVANSSLVSKSLVTSEACNESEKLETSVATVKRSIDEGDNISRIPNSGKIAANAVCCVNTSNASINRSFGDTITSTLSNTRPEANAVAQDAMRMETNTADMVAIKNEFSGKEFVPTLSIAKTSETLCVKRMACPKLQDSPTDYDEAMHEHISPGNNVSIGDSPESVNVGSARNDSETANVEESQGDVEGKEITGSKNSLSSAIQTDTVNEIFLATAVPKESIADPEIESVSSVDENFERTKLLEKIGSPRKEVSKKHDTDIGDYLADSQGSLQLVCSKQEENKDGCLSTRIGTEKSKNGAKENTGTLKDVFDKEKSNFQQKTGSSARKKDPDDEGCLSVDFSLEAFPSGRSIRTHDQAKTKNTVAVDSSIKGDNDFCKSNENAAKKQQETDSRIKKKVENRLEISKEHKATNVPQQEMNAENFETKEGDASDECCRRKIKEDSEQNAVKDLPGILAGYDDDSENKIDCTASTINSERLERSSSNTSDANTSSNANSLLHYMKRQKMAASLCDKTVIRKSPYNLKKNHDSQKTTKNQNLDLNDKPSLLLIGKQSVTSNSGFKRFSSSSTLSMMEQLDAQRRKMANQRIKQRNSLLINKISNVNPVSSSSVNVSNTPSNARVTAIHQGNPAVSTQPTGIDRKLMDCSRFERGKSVCTISRMSAHKLNKEDAEENVEKDAEENVKKDVKEDVEKDAEEDGAKASHTSHSQSSASLLSASNSKDFVSNKVTPGIADNDEFTGDETIVHDKAATLHQPTPSSAENRELNLEPLAKQQRSSDLGEDDLILMNKSGSGSTAFDALSVDVDAPVIPEPIASHRISTEDILASVTDDSLSVSPIPPSPPRQRVTPLLSPLPVTPQPEILSPLCSSPEILSPPALGDELLDGPRSKNILAPKPLIMTSLRSIRLLNFDRDDDRNASSQKPGTMPQPIDSGNDLEMSQSNGKSGQNTDREFPSKKGDIATSVKVNSNAEAVDEIRPQDTPRGILRKSQATKASKSTGKSLKRTCLDRSNESSSVNAKNRRMLRGQPDRDVFASLEGDARDINTRQTKNTHRNLDNSQTELSDCKDAFVIEKQDATGIVNTKRNQKIETANEILDRDANQTEFDYVRYCLSCMKNGSEASIVTAKFRFLKNVASSTTVVSAIISYLKSNTEDDLRLIYGESYFGDTSNQKSSTATKNMSTNLTENSDKIVNNSTTVSEKFINAPYLTVFESKVLSVIKESLEIRHLNAVVSILLRLMPKSFCNEEAISYCGLQSLCRVFTALCRWKNKKEEIRSFVCKMASDVGFSFHLDSILLSCYCVWPQLFVQRQSSIGRQLDKSIISTSPISFTIQTLAVFIAMKHERDFQKQVLLKIFHWLSAKDNILDELAESLLDVLKDAELMEQRPTGKNSSKSCAFEVVKAIELLSVHQKWEWCDDYLIGQRLCNIFNSWNKQLKNGTSVTEKAVEEIIICSAIRLAGMIIRRGINCGHYNASSTVYKTLLTTCAGILQKSQLENLISMRIQIAAGSTLIDLSPVNPSLVSSILKVWLEDKGKKVPNELHQATACIHKSLI